MYRPTLLTLACLVLTAPTWAQHDTLSPGPEVIPEQVHDPSEPLIIAEVMPEFPGGTEAMYAYFKRNQRYPETMREAGIQGTVYVSFVVGTDGRITEVKVLRGVPDGEPLNEEALRLVNAMPNWIPGKQNGKAVRVRFNLPIRFLLH
jgi:protein TonB